MTPKELQRHMVLHFVTTKLHNMLHAAPLRPDTKTIEHRVFSGKYCFLERSTSKRTNRGDIIIEPR
jgi:hypothetical protein